MGGGASGAALAVATSATGALVTGAPDAGAGACEVAGAAPGGGEGAVATCGLAHAPIARAAPAISKALLDRGRIAPLPTLKRTSGADGKRKACALHRRHAACRRDRPRCARGWPGGRSGPASSRRGACRAADGDGLRPGRTGARRTGDRTDIRGEGAPGTSPADRPRPRRRAGACARRVLARARVTPCEGVLARTTDARRRSGRTRSGGGRGGGRVDRRTRPRIAWLAR
jgi:hypothetical protein